jgi:hypothetical protein
LKQDVERELERKLPPLIPFFSVFLATKKGTTTLLSLAFVFGFVVAKKATTTKLSSAFVFGFVAIKKATMPHLLI